MAVDGTESVKTSNLKAVSDAMTNRMNEISQQVGAGGGVELFFDANGAKTGTLSQPAYDFRMVELDVADNVSALDEEGLGMVYVIKMPGVKLPASGTRYIYLRGQSSNQIIVTNGTDFRSTSFGVVIRVVGYN